MPETQTSKILTVLSIVVGLLGIASLILACQTYGGGRIMGYGPDFWFFEALAMFLIAIWLKLLSHPTNIH